MAETVRTAETIVAGEVSVRASAVRSVTGGEVEVRSSAVQHLRGDRIDVEESAVALASAGGISITDSQALAIAGRDVQASNVRTLVLLSPRVRGQVRTVFDWKGALAIGVGIVLARRALRLLRLA